MSLFVQSVYKQSFVLSTGLSGWTKLPTVYLNEQHLHYSLFSDSQYDIQNLVTVPQEMTSDHEIWTLAEDFILPKYVKIVL